MQSTAFALSSSATAPFLKSRNAGFVSSAKLRFDPVCLSSSSKSTRFVVPASSSSTCKLSSTSISLQSRLSAWSPLPLPSTAVRRRSGGDAVVVKATAVPGSGGESSAEAATEEESSSMMKTLQLGSLFGLWYLFNIYFNIYNKQVLKVFPNPMTVTMVQFAVGTVLVLSMWGSNLYKKPKITGAQLMAILPLACVHTLGNLFTNMSLGKVAVSFTHTIKATEPFFSVILSAMFLGETPTLWVVSSLVPIIGGVVLASATEMVKEIKKINDHLDNLRSWLPDANVLKELENTCFYELAMLHLFQPNFRHSYPLLQAIISCYDAKLRLFKFGGQNVLFGLEDVVYMTGLNVDGEAVSGWDGEYKDICQTYLGIDGKVGKTGCVSLSWLRENFKTVPASALNDPNKLLHYVRAYVLFIIGCVVCPDQSGKFVSISFLRLLNTKEDFNRYAWGAALLAHLHRSLDHFLSPRNKGNLDGHSYSLMLFAIERIPRMGLYLMGNKKEPDENAITTFKEGRPGEFPLLKGWAEKLHHATHNNHNGKDANTFAMILATVRPDEIEWRPYQRLKADFLPGHLMGTEVMGLSLTILLCFSSAAQYLPNKCFKQFGLTKAPRTTQKPLIIKMKQRAGQHRDWKSWKKFAKYNAMWNERRQHLICQNMPPNELHDNDLDHNIHSDGSPSSHPVDDHRVAPNDGHSSPLTCSPTDPTLLSTGMPPMNPTMPPVNHLNALDDEELNHSIHSDGSPFSHLVDDLARNGHSPPLSTANERQDGAGDEIGGDVVQNESGNEEAKSAKPTKKRKVYQQAPNRYDLRSNISPPRATKKRKVYQRAPNRYDLRSNIKTPQALESASNVRNVHSMREEGIQNDRQLLGCPQH